MMFHRSHPSSSCRPQPPSSKILIFDWDDTICPSTYMDRHQVEHVSDMSPPVSSVYMGGPFPSFPNARRSVQHRTHKYVQFQKLFSDIARCAARTLHEASKYGEVIIITNSDEGWVKYSCERFVPSLLHIIESYKIVSARTGYEKYYPGQPLCWKAAAFAHEVNEHYESSSQGSVDSDDMNTSMGSYEGSVDSLDSVSSMKFEGQREILSFGDSMEERTSVRIVAEQLGAVPKSVMFVQAPSPIQIIGQLQLLTQHMKFVCEHKGKLDLEISAEQAQRFADAYIRRTKPVIDEGFVKSLSNMLIPTDAYKKQQER